LGGEKGVSRGTWFLPERGQMCGDKRPKRCPGGKSLGGGGKRMIASKPETMAEIESAGTERGSHGVGKGS